MTLRPSWRKQRESRLEADSPRRRGSCRLLDETAYYESGRKGIGKKFRESVNESFALLRSFPLGGALGPANTRRTKVKGFPFTIVYRDTEREIVVFAIAPDRQQPGYWLPRALRDG